MSRRSDVFLAFLTGAAVGASLGVLFAPEKGEITREKLGIKLEKYKDKLKELILKYSEIGATATDNSANESNPEYTSAAKSEGQKVVKDVRSQAEALLNDVEDLIFHIKAKK
ncbi:MAG: YtxH domain-containing protein [Cytophagales bacterium]|nr:YtxH domain-containing protein [Cytophagales bacterium]